MTDPAHPRPAPDAPGPVASLAYAAAEPVGADGALATLMGRLGRVAGVFGDDACDGALLAHNPTAREWRLIPQVREQLDDLLDVIHRRGGASPRDVLAARLAVRAVRAPALAVLIVSADAIDVTTFDPTRWGAPPSRPS